MEEKLIRNLGVLLYTKGVLINLPDTRTTGDTADVLATLAEDIKQQEIDYVVALRISENPNPERMQFVEWYLAQLRSLLADCQNLLEVK